MKYKGQASVTALMCGIVLVCIFLPIVLAVAIPVLIITIIVCVVEAKKETKAREQQAKANNYLFELDTMETTAFAKNTDTLIGKAISHGYVLNGYTTFTLAKHYQSIDNIGIGIVRKDLASNGMVITNRYLTPKAREYCRNGRILVVDRSVLYDMYVFLAKVGMEITPHSTI